MATIPWKSTAHRSTISAEDTASATAVLQVSRLELQHLRDVPGFIIAAMRLRRDAVMKHYSAKMLGSHFHTWFSGDATQRPSWPDAQTRLEKTRPNTTTGPTTART